MTNDLSFDLELIHIREVDIDLELTSFTSIPTLGTDHDEPWATDTAQLATGIPSTGIGQRPLLLNEVDTPQYIRGTALYTLIVGLTMAAFLLMIDSTILVTVSQSEYLKASSTQDDQAIPTITNAFNSLDDVGWYGSTYLLTR